MAGLPRRLFGSWQTGDLQFRLLVRLGRCLVPKYRFKWPQMDWWQHRGFADYLEKFGEARGLNADRRWTVAQALRLIDAVPGDTAECGVYQGAGSYLICRANSMSSIFARHHHVFDSFAGLSQPSTADGAHWHPGDLSCPLEVVQKNLAEFSAVSYHPGWIPERFADVAERTFAFVHIDVDLERPTRDSMNFFYPRMNPGGIILCDDYGFETCRGATHAIDAFLTDKPEKMLALSGGGGLLVKGCPTAGLVV